MPAVRLFRPDQETGAGQSLLVRDVIALYLRHCLAEGVHSPAARADREFTFKLFCEACGNIQIVDVKPYHLTDFIEAHPEWKSVSTRRKYAGAIKAAFGWASRQERIDRNPFANVRYAEAERRPEIPDADLDRINTAANKPTERILRFIRLTGCRSSEACNAMWADVDLERGIWTIKRHKSRGRTGKAKVVALVGEAVSLLRSIRGDVAPADAVIAGTPAMLPDIAGTAKPIIERPIFLNTRNRPWDRISLWKAMTGTKKRAGIQSPGAVHSIRHTAATAMVAAGAPLALVAAQLGHSKPDITAKWYVHVENRMDELRAAAERGVPHSKKDP